MVHRVPVHVQVYISLVGCKMIDMWNDTNVYGRMQDKNPLAGAVFDCSF